MDAVQDTSCTRCELHQTATSICVRGEWRTGGKSSNTPLELAGDTDSSDLNERAAVIGRNEGLGRAGPTDSAELLTRAEEHGSTDKKVRIMVLGEAPGYNEDQQG